MKKFGTLLFILTIFLGANTILYAQTTYYSKSGYTNPLSPASWSLTTDGSGSSPNNFTSGDKFIIQNGHAMSLAGGSWMVSGTNSEVQIAGSLSISATSSCTTERMTILTSGLIDISPGNQLTVNNGNISGDDLIIDGVMQNAGAVNFGPGAVGKVGSSGFYEHTGNGGIIPLLLWDASSTCKISGVTTSLPSGLNQQFDNFIYEATSQTTDVQFTGIPLINGSFTVASTGSGSLLVGNSYATIFIGLDFIQTGGVLDFSSTPGVKDSLIINRDFIQSGGTITMSGGGGGEGRILIDGENNSLIATGVVGSNISYTINGECTLGSNITISTEMVVNGILHFNSFIVDGPGDFLNSSNSSLVISDKDGIWKSVPLGNVQVTGTRLFATNASYTYSGMQSQTTGDGLPGSVLDLIVDNANGLTTSQSVQVDGKLNLVSGLFDIADDTLTLMDAVIGNDANINVEGGTVRYFSNSNGQRIIPTSYLNLEFNDMSKDLSNGVFRVSGTFVPGYGIGHNISNSEIDFNGLFSQTIPAFTYYDLTISNSRLSYDVYFSFYSPISIEGDFTPTATFTSGKYITSGSTILFTGNSAQTLPEFPYYNLSVNKGENSLDAAGMLTVANNLVLDNGELSLSTVSGSDLRLGGNFENNGGIFYSNGRTVWFVGDADQTIYDYSGTVSFNKMGIEKLFGIVQLFSTNVNITDSDNEVLTLRKAAQLDLHSYNLKLTGSNVSVSVDSAGNTIFASTGRPSLECLGNASIVAFNGGTLFLDSSVVFAIHGWTDFGPNITTIKGALVLEVNSEVVNNPPIYLATSSLQYNTRDVFNRGLEWSSNSGAGYPFNVLVVGTTTLNLGSNGGANTNWKIAGDLFIESGSIFSMNEVGNEMTAPLTVLGNITNDGTLILSSLYGGDVELYGDFNSGENAAFTHNHRSVWMLGSKDQVIHDDIPIGDPEFGSLRLNKPSGRVDLDAVVSILDTLDLQNTNIQTNSFMLTIDSTGHLLRTTGYIIGDLYYNIPVGANISRTYSIGDAATYTPVDLNFSTVIGAAIVGVSSSKTGFQVSTPAIDSSKGVDRYWTFSNNGIIFDTLKATFHFDSTDFFPGSLPENFGVVSTDGVSQFVEPHGMRNESMIQAVDITSLKNHYTVRQYYSWTITPTAYGDGMINPSIPLTVDDGGFAQFNISANPNHHVDSVLIDGIRVDSLASYTFTNITANHSIEAFYSPDQYTISAYSSGSGMVNPNGSFQKSFGDSVVITITPDQYYHIDSVVVNNVNIGSPKVYSVNPVTGPINLTAYFGDKAPVFVNGFPDTIFVQEDSLLSFNVHANDADGDSVIYQLVSQPTGMQIDSLTGNITWHPTYTDMGIYFADIVVKDSLGLSSTHTQTFRVLNTNRAPYFNAAIPDTFFTAEGNIFSYNVSAADDDGDSIYYELLGQRPGMNINFTTGAITWTPDYFQAGVDTFEIRIRNIDGLSTSAFPLIIIQSTNRVPQFIGGFPDTFYVAEGMPFTDSVKAFDPDGGTVKYCLTGAPAGMTIDSVTGLLTWNPNFAQAGVYTFQIHLKDSLQLDTARTQIISVFNVDLVPHFVTTIPDTLFMTENVPFSLDVNATDDDGDAVYYELLAFPGGMMIDSVTGVINWTPSFMQSGVDSFFIRVYNLGGLSNAKSVVAVIANTNRAPSFVSAFPDTFFINETQMFSYNVNAVDPDSDAVKYVLFSAPIGMAIDSTTGVITWLPTLSQSGNYLFQIKTIDAKNSETVRTQYISVRNAFLNVASSTLHGIVNPMDTTIAFFGDTLHYTFTPELHYHIDSVVVNNINLGAIPSYTLNGVTSDNFLHVYFSIDMFTITASADTNGSISPSGQLNVSYGDTVIFSITPKPYRHIVDVLVDGISVGAVANYSFKAIQANHTIDAFFAYDSYNLNIIAENGAVSASPNQATYLYGSTVQLTAIPDTGYHFVNWSGDTISIVNPLTLTVTKNISLTANFAIDSFLIVTNVFGNGRIVPSGDTTVHFGDSLVYAILPDLHYHIDSVLVDGINQGIISQYTFSNITTSHSLKAYFSIDEFTLTTSAQHGMIVKNPNGVKYDYGTSVELQAVADTGYHFVNWSGDTISIVNPLTLTITKNISLTANFAVDSFVIIASTVGSGTLSPNGITFVKHGDSLRYTITPAIGHMIDSVVIDSVNNGILSQYTFFNITKPHTLTAYFSLKKFVITAFAVGNGTITPNGVTMVSYGDSLRFQFSAAAKHHLDSVVVDKTNKGQIASFTFFAVDTAHTLAAFFSKNPNQNPVFVKVLSDTTINENQQLSFTNTAQDSDGDTLSFSLSSAPAGMTLNAVSGVLSWKPLFTQSGNYSFGITVSDGKGGSITKIVLLSVKNTNRLPFFTKVLSDTVINEDEQFQFKYTAVDPDSDSISFALISGAEGAQLSQNGTLQWHPTFEQAGNYTFVVRVKDSTETATDSAKIIVLNTNRAPQFTVTLPDTQLEVGQQLHYMIKGSDADNDSVLYKILSAPQGINLSASGIFDWTPNTANIGQNKILYAVSDGSIDTQDSVLITVVQTNRKPIFTATLPDTVISENQQLQFTYSATDEDNDTLHFQLLSEITGMKIDSTGKLQWLPSFTQAGKYSIIIAVKDKYTASLDSAIITVLNVNRAPQFTVTPNDTAFLVDSTLRLRYIGADPDNDSIFLTVNNTFAGMSIDSTGTLQWKALPSQMGFDTVVVNLSDGKLTVRDTVIVQVIGYPKLRLFETAFDFKTITFGDTKTLAAHVKNSGYIPLRIAYQMQTDSAENFSSIFDTIIVTAGKDSAVSLSFTPAGIGTHTTQIFFTTNDVHNPLIAYSLSGSAVTNSPIKKKILVDKTHAPAISLSDSASGYTQLFSALQSSGITPVLSDTVFNPSGYDAVLLVAPQKQFDTSEVRKLRDYTAAGGLVMMLGNIQSEQQINQLNVLLSNKLWESIDSAGVGISINNNIISDTLQYYGNDFHHLLLTDFVDTAHPYVKGIDTVVFFNSASLSVSGKALTFLRSSKSGIASSVSDSVQPAVVAIRSLGDGKIIVFGDVDMWRNSRTDDSISNILVYNNLALAINMFTVTENYRAKMPAPTPVEQYRIVSIPFDLHSPNIQTVLKDLGEPGPYTWRMFGRWNPLEAKYREYPSEGFTNFSRGEAYWLITKQAKQANFGTATIVPEQEFFSIKIGPGYSLIGNPFPYKVSWKRSKHDSTESILWKFDGKGFTAESLMLEPFAGYFVKNISEDSTTIFINPNEITAANLPKGASQQEVFAEQEWKVNISATSGTASDMMNIAGVSRTAKEEWDRFDVSEPPPSPTGYLIVAFNRPQWKRNAGTYAVDIHPIAEEGQYWDFSITSATVGAKVDAAFAPEGNLPENFKIYLVDMRTERVIQLEKGGGYQFAMNGSERRRYFRIVVGTLEYVEKNTAGIPLVPLDFALHQNFPNPFNPATTVRYALGHSGNVTLTIYNILGQRVRTLLNETQTIGLREIQWDGKNDLGLPVASGVYFYRINVQFQDEQLFSTVKKMVLMK